MRFCFVIGAGASKSSGIPTGQELAAKWYQQILEDLDPEELENWKAGAKNANGEFQPSYYQIFKKRFQYAPEIGSKELQSQVHNAQPGLGYLILAKLLEKTQHNFVISTNFDHLIEMALFTATSQPPLVCSQEKLHSCSLAQSSRPIIVKTHRDLMFSSYLAREKENEIVDECKETLTAILKSFRLIVIGSGGNDEKFMKFLQSVSPDQRQSIFWCTRDPFSITPQVHKILDEKDFIVSIDSFDGLMYQLSSISGLDEIFVTNEPNSSPLILKSIERTKHYIEEFNQLSGSDISIDSLATKPEVSPEAKPALATKPKPVKTVDTVSASNYLSETPKKSGKDALQGIELSQKDDINDLMNDILKSNEKSGKELNCDENHHIRELEKAPDSVKNNVYYALFLEHKQKDYQKADHYFVKALNIEPNHARINGLYANFLINAYDEYDKAELHYVQALRNAPDDATLHVLYAIFLQNIRKDYALAESHYKKAIDAGQQSMNHTAFMKDIRQDYQAAESYYRKALELDLENEIL